MKPKIVLLSAFLSPLRSGAESCVEEVAVRLADRYDITIITARMRRSLPKDDVLGGKVTVRRVGLGIGFDKWLFPFLAPFAARRVRPTIIHAVLETFAGLALHICKYIVPKAKRILTLQTTNRSFLKGLIIRSPDYVTAISNVLIEIAAAKGRNDVTRIPNGLDLDHVPNLPKEPGRILFVGRLEAMKGIDTLLAALAQVTSYKLQVTSHLRIVGDGSERANLEKLAEELHISDYVTFVGFVPIPQVYEEFAKAEVFCGLSRSEALGNVFLEAQASGCAVLGTRVGGIPDIVEEGRTGLLVPAGGDVGSAAEALERLLTDQELRSQLSQAGRENAKAYDWSLIAKQYAAVYDRATS